MKNEMTIAEIKAMYFDDEALMLSPFPLYRYHYKGDRFYYYTDPINEPLDEISDCCCAHLKNGDICSACGEHTSVLKGEPQPVHFAVGVTTLTRKTIPQDEFLTKWIADKGWDDAIAFRDLRAFYGSLLHTILATLLIKRVCNLDLFDEVVRNYCKANGVVTNQSVWVDDLKQDTLAFAEWMKTYNVKPFAIELSLVSPRLGVAGTLDLFCEMDYTEKGFFGEVYLSGVNKGQPKESKRTVRRLAIVDFKSGRNSTGGLHNAAQLRLLDMLLKDAYPQFSDQTMLLYNWHPKDWRAAPNYTFVDQTNSFSEGAALSCIALYQELYPQIEEKKTLEMFGTISLDSPEDEQHNYATPLIKDLVQAAVNDATFTQTEYDLTDTYFDENQPDEQ